MTELLGFAPRTASVPRFKYGEGHFPPGSTQSHSPPPSAESLASTVVRRLAVDRCVVVDFDGYDYSLVLAAAGLPLCQPGTKLPIELSTMYCKNRDGEVFVGEHLELSAAFRRISDGALVALGVRSAVSIPRWREGQVSGAIYAAVVQPRISERKLSPGRLAEIVGETESALEHRNRSNSESLTQRELEVLVAMSSGLTNRQIGTKLVISPHTVSNHTRAIYRKLEVTSKVGALQKAHLLGIIDLGH